MNYYNEIKNKLIDNEIYSRLKDYSKEKHKVIIYFEIGRLLTEADCYVVVELKVTEFKVEYISQVQKIHELHR